MNHIQRFVFGSSLILACWLAATFFNDVPAHRYPRLDKNSMNLSAAEPEEKRQENPVVVRAERLGTISISQ